MSEAEKSYGGHVYDVLKAMGGYAHIVGSLNYDQIQQLKTADENSTLKLFFGKAFAIPKVYIGLDPKTFAEMLVRDSNKQAAAMVAMMPCIF